MSDTLLTTLEHPSLHAHTGSRRNIRVAVGVTYPFESIAKQCRIEPGFLEAGGQLATPSRCADISIRLVRRFVDTELAPSVRDIIVSHRYVERSALVATELLGGGSEDDISKFEYKKVLHLLMTVEMTLQMLFDDQLDMFGRVSDCVRVTILDQVLASFNPRARAEDFDRSADVTGFWSTMLQDLRALQSWRNCLLLSSGIETGPGSVSRRLYLALVDSYLHTHGEFQDIEAFLAHRTNNCGMPLQAFWAAHWHCMEAGVALRELEESAEQVVAILERYAVLGGLSNDIVGYDKDLIEGIETSVNVFARRLSGPWPERLEKSFKAMINRHNRLLDELSARLGRSEGGALESVILWTALLATWSILVLHMHYLDVYQPQSLTRYLRTCHGRLQPASSLVVESAI